MGAVFAHLVEALADGLRRVLFLELHDLWLAHVLGAQGHHAFRIGG